MTTVLTQAIAKVLLLPILVTALAVLVKGYTDTGDGFSAGVIAGFGVLLQYLAFGFRAVEARLPLRIAPYLAWAGLLIVLLIAFVPVLLGEPILTHFPAPEDHVIQVGTLEVHTAVAFDVGIFLVVFGFTVQIMRMVAQVKEWEES